MTSTPEYSPGLEGVIAGETAVSTIEGGLRYRGYNVSELAERSSFDEVAYLLLHGELPSGADLDGFRARVASARAVPGTVIDVYRALPANASAMEVLRTGVSVLAHHDPETGSNDHEANVRKAERLLARIPTIIAARSRLNRGLVPVEPRADLDYSANLLYMLNGTDPDEVERNALDVSLILYAEHEYNASTFAARVTASTLADLYGAVVAGIAALRGPLHGGANEAVVEMLEEVGGPDRAEAWIRDALEDRRLVMGFGHRIYKVEDPRATILKEFCGRLAPERGATEWEEMAETIERVMWEEKRIPPNMDYPAGRLYRMIGLETELYTPLFVASRVTGWAAHVIEQHDDNRLVRPRANYTGPPARQYVPIEQR